MTMLDDIRRDREQGGGGSWEMWTIANTWIMRGDVHVATIPTAHDGDWSPANARRIARVPQMEAALLAAERVAQILADAIHEHDTADHEWRGNENPWTMREWFDDEDRAALDAFRAAMEARK